MKKLICALLPLALGLSLAACSSWSVEIKEPEDLSTGSAEEDESSSSEERENTAPFEIKEVIMAKDFLGEAFLEKYGFDLESIILAETNGETIYFVAGGYPKDSGHHIYKDYIEMLFSINYDGAELSGPYITKSAGTNRYSVVFDLNGEAFIIENNINLRAGEDNGAPEYTITKVGESEAKTIVSAKDIDGKIFDSVTNSWANSYTFVDSVANGDDGNWYVTMSGENAVRVLVLDSDFNEIRREEDKKVGGLMRTPSGKLVCIDGESVSLFDTDSLAPSDVRIALPEGTQMIFGGNSFYDLICVTEAGAFGVSLETGETVLLTELAEYPELYMVSGVFVSDDGTVIII
ncbi:MAG: hypothetical protein ACI4IW_00460 [Oscillospiraceae bacterium]